MSSVTLLILGDNLDPRTITKLLALRPNQAWKKGENKSFRRKDGSTLCLDSIHEWGGWKKWSTNAERKKQLPKLIDHWCNKLTHKKKALGRIKALQNKIFFDCCIVARSEEIYLPPNLLKKISSLGITLDITFYSTNNKPNKGKERIR